MRTLLFLALAGCTTEVVQAPDPPAMDPEIGARLRECGLLSPGELGASRFYAPTACYVQCLATASCEELDAALCNTSIDLLRRCDEACALACPDGTLLAVEQRCDGRTDCEGGTDERNCPSCVEAHPDWVCNGFGQCADLSDERDCDSCNQFGRLCNGVVDCADGRDEASCFRCRTGEMTIQRELRCDGWSSCWDGSDEAGCAAIAASCGG
jgi:hypothetical protein